MCSACKGTFHLACGGITENSYRRLTLERRALLKCKQCKNTKTPVSVVSGASETISGNEHLEAVKKINNKGPTTTAQAQINLEDLQGLVLDKTSNLESKQNDILEQNKKILESIQFMSAQYEDFLGKIREIEARNEVLTKKNIDLEARINVLENCLEIQERALKANNLEIRGIPENKGEILQDVIFNICQKTKSNIQIKDIDAIHRAAKKINNIHPREIIVKLKSNIAKEQLIEDVKSYNKNNPNIEDKLNTANIGIAGPISRIYVSEQLTFRGKQLFWKTRQAAKTKGWRFTWSKAGLVYIRRDTGSNAIWISDEDKLAAL